LADLSVRRYAHHDFLPRIWDLRAISITGKSADDLGDLDIEQMRRVYRLPQREEASLYRPREWGAE
jgi:hypothetical protein